VDFCCFLVIHLPSSYFPKPSLLFLKPHRLLVVLPFTVFCLITAVFPFTFFCLVTAFLPFTPLCLTAALKNKNLSLQYLIV